MDMKCSSIDSPYRYLYISDETQRVPMAENNMAQHFESRRNFLIFMLGVI